MVMGNDVEVAIIGAGLAGLFVAAELRSRGINEIVVLDSADAPGGLLKSVEEDGFILEPAAGSFLLPHPVLSKGFAQLGAEVVPAAPCASTRFVFTRGRLVEIKPTPKAVFAPVVSWPAKFRGLRELRMPRRGAAELDESLEDFLVRRFGRELGSLGAKLAASGVFAGDPKQLSASAAFPMLTGLEDQFGSVLAGIRARMKQRPANVPKPQTHVPMGSMANLAREAATAFGDLVQLGARVDAIVREGGTWQVTAAREYRAKHVVIAIDPIDAAALVSGELGDLLSQITYAPVAVVGLGGTASEVPLPSGFGVLPGHDEPLATRGVLFESSYAPHRAQPGNALAKIIMGGSGYESILDGDDASLVARALRDTNRMLGRTLEPSFTRVVRHSRGIPQYNAGHAKWRAQVESLVDNEPGLHLGGWGFYGVGVAHLAADAQRICTRIGQPTP